MVTSADADPPCPSVTSTRIVTGPSESGAVHRAVAASAAPPKLPAGALQAYVNSSPSGSDAVAVSSTSPSRGAAHGSHDTDTPGSSFSTSMVTSADADPSSSSVTSTRMVTGPSESGAVQRAVAASAAPLKLPAGALQAYVSSSPSGSDAVAVSSTSPRRGTAHGSHDSDTLGNWFSTSMVTRADADPPCPSVTSTRMVTGPSESGAVHHAVAASVVPLKLPAGALQAYVSSSPSGSDAVAVSSTSPSRATAHGSHDAHTLGDSFRTSTSTVTSADADPPCPSVTSTRIVTGPSESGAVHRAVAASATPLKLPAGALQAYVSSSPSGSDAVAVSSTSPSRATAHGSHDTDTPGGRFRGSIVTTPTVTATVAVADPPRLSETSTPIVTRPVVSGAVQRVAAASVTPLKAP